MPRISYRILRSATLAAALLALTPPAPACPSGGGEVVRPHVARAHRDGAADAPAALAIPPIWSFPRTVEGISDYNSDCRPTITADGTLALFESTPNTGPPYDPVNHTSGKFYIYETEWDGAEWTDLHALDPTKFTGHNHPCVSADGTRLFTTRGGRIFVADRDGSEWDTPTELFGEINDLPFGKANGASSLTPDLSEIYFASNRTGGLGGGYDIWVCRLSGDYTDSLTHLGAGPNSTGSEVRPAISPSGRYLLFSDFAGSRPSLDYGETDLYISELVGGTWSTPEPVPAPVNNYKPACSAAWASETEVLISSGVCEGGKGAEDIWSISIGTAGAGEGRIPSLAGSKRMARLRRLVGRRSATAAAASDAAIRPPGRWERIANLPGARIVEDLYETSGGVLLASTSDEGFVFRSFDGGYTWNRRPVSPTVMRVYSFLERSDGRMLVGTYPNGTLFESTNAGFSWTALGALPSWVTAVRSIEELDSGDLLVGVAPETLATDFFEKSTGRIFKSTDDGANWSALAPLDLVASAVTAIHERDDGTIWVGSRTYGGGLHYTTDGGASWAMSMPDYPEPPTLATVIHFMRDSAGGLWGMGWAHGETGAFVMRNSGGVDWELPHAFERGEHHDDFVYDLAENDHGWLFAGTQPSGGSPGWISIDGGDTWNPTTSMPGANEMTALIALDDGRVLGGTTGDGAIWEWRRTVLEAAR